MRISILPLLLLVLLNACADGESTNSDPAQNSAGSGPAGAAGSGGALAGAAGSEYDASADSNMDSDSSPADTSFDTTKDASHDSPYDASDASDEESVSDAGSECTNECVGGEGKCVAAGLQTCEVSSATGCTVWGSASPCDSDETCSQGKCVACANPCQSGQSTCDGNAVKSCTQSGNCWDWGAPAACGTTQTCSNGKCEDIGPTHSHLEIYIDNFCHVSIVPSSYNVASGQSLLISYHNNSVDYEADVWASYGGGYLQLATGDIWDDQFEWCAGTGVYTGWVDISIYGGGSSACPKQRLTINCN